LCGWLGHKENPANQFPDAYNIRMAIARILRGRSRRRVKLVKSPKEGELPKTAN
jgi:hypothetical protein